MILLEWEQLAVELEGQARTVRAGEGARMLKDKVEEAMSIAEMAVLRLISWTDWTCSS